MKNNTIVNVGSFFITSDSESHIIKFGKPFLNTHYTVNMSSGNAQIVLSDCDKTPDGFGVKYYIENDTENYPIKVDWSAIESKMTIEFLLRPNPWLCRINFIIDNDPPFELTIHDRSIAEKEFSRWSKSSSNTRTYDLISKKCQISEGREIWANLIIQGWIKK